MKYKVGDKGIFKPRDICENHLKCYGGSEIVIIDIYNAESMYQVSLECSEPFSIFEDEFYLEESEVTHSENKIQGSHYKDKIECIEVLEQLERSGADYATLQAIRYLWRQGKKTGESKEKDLKKAINYLMRSLNGEWFFD